MQTSSPQRHVSVIIFGSIIRIYSTPSAFPPVFFGVLNRPQDKFRTAPRCRLSSSATSSKIRNKVYEEALVLSKTILLWVRQPYGGICGLALPGIAGSVGHDASVRRFSSPTNGRTSLLQKLRQTVYHLSGKLEFETYRINWHIVPPYVARARQIPSLKGGTIEKGIYYVDGLCTIQILLGRVSDPPLGGVL